MMSRHFNMPLLRYSTSEDDTVSDTIQDEPHELESDKATFIGIRKIAATMTAITSTLSTRMEEMEATLESAEFADCV
jgi:hypothetical protein